MDMSKGSKKRYKLAPGNEIRGMRIRLYPDNDTIESLESLERDARKAWNWLVKQTEDTLQARSAYAIRSGLVSNSPTRPIYEGMSPEEAKAAKKEYIAASAAWYQAVHAKTKSIPECAFRSFKTLLEHYGCKYDYQLLSKVVGWVYEEEDTRNVKPGAHFFQALTRNYFSSGKNQRRKKFRKSSDPMPLQVRSGECFFLGNFGTRRDKPFYNCQVKINGLTIRGRLPGKQPEGRVLEGVSVVREADGWWAAVKVEVPIREVPLANPGTVIGLDMGLDNIVAMSDGTRIENPRGKIYAERIAGRQSMKLPVGRLHQKASKHMRHLIYNCVVKPLAAVETIKVERLQARIGQMGSAKTSVMRTIYRLLIGRYGDRVREVDPAYTSQDCSQCGTRSKESWSYEHGRFGKCPSCGYYADRDVNAARNIAARPLISLST